VYFRVCDFPCFFHDVSPRIVDAGPTRHAGPSVAAARGRGGALHDTKGRVGFLLADLAPPQEAALLRVRALAGHARARRGSTEPRVGGGAAATQYPAARRVLLQAVRVEVPDVPVRDAEECGAVQEIRGWGAVRGLCEEDGAVKGQKTKEMNKVIVLSYRFVLFFDCTLCLVKHFSVFVTSKFQCIFL